MQRADRWGRGCGCGVLLRGGCGVGLGWVVWCGVVGAPMVMCSSLVPTCMGCWPAVCCCLSLLSFAVCCLLLLLLFTRPPQGWCCRPGVAPQAQHAGDSVHNWQGDTAGWLPLLPHPCSLLAGYRLVGLVLACDSRAALTSILCAAVPCCPASFILLCAGVHLGPGLP